MEVVPVHANACCSWRWAAATTTLMPHCDCCPLGPSLSQPISSRSPFVPPPCAGMRCSMRALLLCAALAVLCACSLPLASGWKPRSLPRTAAAAGAPRHRFFLPNPCVLNDERTGAHYDLTSLRKTGSVTTKQARGAWVQARAGTAAAVTAARQCRCARLSSVAWAVVIVIDHCRPLCHSLSSSLATPRPSRLFAFLSVRTTPARTATTSTR